MKRYIASSRFVVNVFCSTCGTSNIVVSQSRKCFEEAVEEAIEDEEIINCLAKLHDAESIISRKELNRVVLTKTRHSTFFTDKVALDLH